MKRRLRFNLCWSIWLFTSTALAWPLPGGAETNRFSAFDLWPVIDRSFLVTPSTETLSGRQFTAGLSNTFLFRPVEMVNAAGVRTRSAVEFAFVHFLTANVGITDFWQAGLSLPFFSIARFQDPTVAGAAADNVTKVGDLLLNTRIRVLDADRHRWGVAFEPFVTIPVGAEGNFLGEGSVTGGGRVIGDFLITDRIRASMNLGVEFRDRVALSNIDFQHRFLAGLGFSGDVGRGFTVSGELSTRTPFSQFFGDLDHSPLEFLAGAQYEIGETGLSVAAGGGTCAVCGIKGARVRSFVNLTYRFSNEQMKEKRAAALTLRRETLHVTSKEE